MFTQNSNPSIDQQQATRQLELLGYPLSQAIYIRAFLPKEDPHYGPGTGRKANRLNFKELEHWQKQGYGIYFVVNGGGHKDTDVQLCRAVFIEHDDLELQLQRDLWRTAGLPEPTFQVQTRKSVHSYWVFENPIPAEQWRILQTDLLTYTGADPAIKNPSRVMRLAGAWHIKPGCEPLRCEIVSESGKQYTYEQMRFAVPVAQEEDTGTRGHFGGHGDTETRRHGDTETRRHGEGENCSTNLTASPRLPFSASSSLTASPRLPFSASSSPNIQVIRFEDIAVPVTEYVSLKACLAKESRTLLDGGVSQGGRNTGGAKLARDLIGTAAYLQSIGQLFDGDPRQLLDDYATHCTPPLPTKEVDAIWQSALKDNPTPSCPPEGVETCIRSWYWRNYVKPNQQLNMSSRSNQGHQEGHSSSLNTQSVTGDNSRSGDSANPRQLDVSATVTAVTTILSQGLEEWLEQAELDAVLTKSILSKQSFGQLVASLKCQFDEVLPQDKQRLNQLIDWDNTQLNFHNVLPHMAADVLHDAQILNIDPVAIWQYLLPAVLSFLGKQVNLSVGSHMIPALIWTCLVMESGSGKTRAKKLVTSAIEKWQEAETRRFHQEYAEYKEKIAASKKEDPGEKPEPPNPERKYLFKIATMQALMRRLSEQGNNGSLLVRDEIGGWFKSLDQFSGKGETEGLDVFIESWDGDTQQVDRVHLEDSFIVPDPRLSLAGGIQPGVFRKIFKDPEDAQGLQARMLFACLKVMPAKRVKGCCRLYDTLPKLFKWIDEQFPKAPLKLSSSAEALYDKIYESIGIQAEIGATPAIRVWMRKLSSQILRIAMALHTIECFYEPNRPRHEIQLDTLERAIEMGRYYRSAFQVVQEKTADSDSISSILMKIWDLGIANPTGIIARDAYRAVKAIGRRAKEMGRTVGAYTIELFGKLQEMGRGCVEKEGRQFRFVVKLPELPTEEDAGREEDTEMGRHGDTGTQGHFGGHGDTETWRHGDSSKTLPASPPRPIAVSSSLPASPRPPLTASSSHGGDTLENTVTGVTVTQTAVVQGLQVSPDEQVSRVTESSELSADTMLPSAVVETDFWCQSSRRNTTSDELNWLMSLLTDLESQPQPHERFTSAEQLIELFLSAEQKGQCCQEQLNQCCPDYWERVSRRLGEISEVLPDAEQTAVAELEDNPQEETLSTGELTQTEKIKLPENPGVGFATPATESKASVTPESVNALDSALARMLECTQRCCNILDVEQLGYERVKAGISHDAVKALFSQLDETTRSRIKGLKRQLKKHLAALRNGLSVKALDGFYGTICAQSADGRFLVQGQRDRKTGAQEARYYFGAELKPVGTGG